MSRRVSSFDPIKSGVQNNIKTEYYYVKLVADNLGKVLQIADNLGAVNTVSGNITDVNELAAVSEDLQIIVDNLEELLNASSYADTATQKASEAAASEAAAAVSEANALAYKDAASASEVATAALYDAFGDQYLGAYADNPLVDNDGDALVVGALYWNSTDDTLRIYNGTTWLSPVTEAEAAQAAAETSATNAAASEATSSVKASEASDSAQYAEEWANAPEDTFVSAAAGGDQVDDYSAKHHAIKASDSAAATAADVVTTNNNVVATNADVVTTNADAATTTADRIQVDADKNTVASDKATVASDKAVVAADKAAVAADKSSVETDAAQVAADLVISNANVVATNADAAATAQNVIDAEAAKNAAQLAEGNANASANAASTSEGNASTSESNANAAELKAQEWAEKDEDLEVETGKYSAKHHSEKSEQHALNASSSASAAGSSASAASSDAGQVAADKVIIEGYKTDAQQAATDVLNTKAAFDTNYTQFNLDYAQFNLDFASFNSSYGQFGVDYFQFNIDLGNFNAAKGQFDIDYGQFNTGLSGFNTNYGQFQTDFATFSTNYGTFDTNYTAFVAAKSDFDTKYADTLIKHGEAVQAAADAEQSKNDSIANTVTGVSWSGNDMAFSRQGASDVLLVDAKIDLKGDKGDPGTGDVDSVNGVPAVAGNVTLTLADLGFTGATNANYYTHPSYAGDDINLDTGPLTGATVISDLDFNVTTDTLGHVTDANATYATRNITYSDVGAAAASHSHSYLPLSGGTLTGTVGVQGISNSIKVGDITADNYTEIKHTNADGYGFDFQHNNASVVLNQQGTTNEVVVLGDVDAGNTTTLFGVGHSTNGGANWTPKFNFRGDAELYIGSSAQNKVFHDGYHPNADKWTTARTHTVTLTGDVTGSASQTVDGTGNKTWSITTAVANDSHSHSYLPLSGGTVTGTITATNIIATSNGTGTAYKVGDDAYIGDVNVANTMNVRGSQSADRGYISFGNDTTQLGRITTGALTWGGNAVFHDGYHPNADKWTTARTLSLTGDVTGSTSWDGSGNASITATVSNDSHTHSNYVSIDEFKWRGTNALASTTTSELKTELLNRNVFDSSVSAFKTSWHYAANGNLTDAGRFTEMAGTSWITWTDNSTDNTQGNFTALAIAPNAGDSAGKVFIYNDQGSSYSPGWREVWTSASDGAGSGLDADLLDGNHASAFALASHSHSYLPLSGGTLTGALAANAGISQNGFTILNGSDTWLRTNGQAGWYNDTFGGGWYMTDSTYVRTYNNKSIYTAGEVLAGGNVTAYSDRRLKTNIEVIPDALAKVSTLSGYTFDRVDMDTARQTGVIAQEVQAVLPEAVTEDENGTLAVSYGNMVGLLIEAIKEQQAQIDVLKRKLEDN